MIDQPLCDFCSANDPEWDYENYPTSGEDGGWLACDPCHDLIESGNKRGLEDRAVQRPPPSLALVPDGFRREVRGAQARFWDNRKEPAKRILQDT